ncbi:MAG TPA: hypothetical protein VIK81_03980 [Patescibacteria group bacterium]
MTIKIRDKVINLQIKKKLILKILKVIVLIIAVLGLIIGSLAPFLSFIRF